MNANDYLQEHNCTENFYGHQFGMMYTDGVKALCEKFECYWFLDIVVSYQPILRYTEMQVWKLEKTGDSSAVVKCEDGNGKVLVTQDIPYTDFEPARATIWVEEVIILLPSEH